MSVNYATMLTENGGSNLRLLANRVDIQNWGTAQNSNLPLSTQIAASNHTTIVTMSNSNIHVTANILPTACNVFDLGSSNLRFKDLYLSGSTINLDGLLISKDPVSGGMKVTDQANTPVATNTATVTATTSISTPAITTTGLNINIDGKSLSNINTLRTTGNATIGGTLTASNLSIIGDFTTMNTLTSNTEQMVVNNAGTGPALKVIQSGANVIAQFEDAESGSAMFIANGGNVGIGTTTPLAKLVVAGETHLNVMENYQTVGKVRLGRVVNADLRYHEIEVYNDVVASANYMGFNLHDGVTTSNVSRAMTIRGDGNVGIGTTTPLSKLHVQDGSLRIQSASPAISLYETDAAVDEKFAFISQNAGSLIHYFANDGNNSSSQYLAIDRSNIQATNIRFMNGPSTERMRIATDGSVGVGTANPIYKHHVYGNVNASVYGGVHNENTGTGAHTVFALRNSTSAAVFFLNSTSRTVDGGASNATLRNDGGDLLLQSQGGNGISIQKTSGNVGIGVASPSAKLHVNGTARFTGDIYPNSSEIVIRHPTNGSSGTVQLKLNNNGPDQGSPQGPILGVDGALYNATAFLDTYNQGVAAATPLAIRVSGTERMRIDTSGNVGIGVSPSHKLHVANTASQFATNIYCAPSTHATSRRASIVLDDWTLLQDINGNGTKDFSIYQGAQNTNAFAINTLAGVNIGSSSTAAIKGLVVGGNTYLGMDAHRTDHVVSSGLTRYWNFQNTLTDTIASSTFSVTGAVTYQSNSYTGNGSMGSCIQTTNSAANYLSVASPIDQPPFSISFWFYPQSTGVYQRVMSLGAIGATAGAMNVDFNATNYLTFYFAIPNHWIFVGTSFPLALNTWIHITITITSSWLITLYVNGSSHATAQGTANFTTPRSLLFVGTNSDGQNGFMNAQYDDLRIYASRALSATEVSQIFYARSYVGIGTVNPAYKLDVSGDIRTTGSMVFPGPGLNYIGPGGADNATYTDYNLKISSWWGIGFPSYDNINRLIINTRSGGINTVGIIRADNAIDGPPSAYFVSGNTSAGANAYAVSYLTNGSGNCVWFLNSTTRTTDGGSNAATLRNDAGTLHLQSQGGNGITIAQTSGNVTMSGTCSFGSTTRQMLNLWGTAYGIGVQGGTAYFRGSSFAWFVGGAHNDTQYDAGGGTVVMTIDTTSGLRVSGDITAFTTFSDVRMKENVTELPSVLAKMRELRAVDFRWKDDIEYVPRRGTEDVGFIAQEVEAVFPKLVKDIEPLNKSSEKLKGLRYEKMTPYLVRAIQELDEKNQQLERELADLRQIVLSLPQK